MQSKKRQTNIDKIELGCGNHKRDGFFGIDMQNGPQVDLVLNIEKQRLPFKDDSILYIYSSHTFEHLSNFCFVLQEILRVCKHGAIIEIWTPYGKSNDGLLFGHGTFFTETHFKHICYEYDRFYLGVMKGFFQMEKIEYNLFPDIINILQKMNISLDFALEHMFNIALEWGVFMRANKHCDRAQGPQYPTRLFSYGRDK